ncbi:hypothetical protein Daci_3197 [Delftia acidovorans SPH-1]|uniref:Restriction alleviation protein, Lar family n=1 Tax=Delftia acidovorans (strain DSM 14801 / SPH-1) TaxID=398578 RepID=A9BW19_DELAS|nr:Lar family restriction alleviation protein [Delftia acidovorans]ABX35835.1 hypothetical protein Daci_3197 [Delftia acidovorans SPH-1]QPS74892.1 Lar family restriction alleviation protein [Delftia acidovorans]
MTTAPTPSELLPCPFCGAGNTEIRDNGKVWSGMGYTAPTSTSVFHQCRPVAGQPSRAIERVGRDRASAIASWNQRAELEARKPLPLSDERIEGLREQTFSTNNPFCPCDSKTMRKAVRAAERAHGIKET